MNDVISQLSRSLSSHVDDDGKDSERQEGYSTPYSDPGGVGESLLQGECSETGRGASIAREEGE